MNSLVLSIAVPVHSRVPAKLLLDALGLLLLHRPALSLAPCFQGLLVPHHDHAQPFACNLSCSSKLQLCQHPHPKAHFTPIAAGTFPILGATSRLGFVQQSSKSPRQA
jgi:hypothetical protein